MDVLRTRNLLVAMAVAAMSTACAVETAEDENTEIAPETETTPITGSEVSGGGPACGPVLRPGPSGELYVEAYLCPIPTHPEPDPEWENGLETDYEEWVKFESQMPIGNEHK